MDPAISQLRQSIDAIDEQILQLLAARLRLVLQVGAVKRERGLAVYDPAREQSLLQRLATSAPAPLEPDTARRIFEVIVAESRALEQVHR